MAMFTNQATLSYSGGILTSNTTVGEIVEVLSMTKTVISDGYTTGDTMTYAISISNTGAKPYNALTVTDDLGAFTQMGILRYPLTYVEGSLRLFTNGVPQPNAPSVNAGPPLTISGFSVPADGNVMLIYEASANQFASPVPGDSITNTASLTGEGLSTSVTADATAPAAEEARLNIFKSLCPATVTENSTLTYTFLIENTGNIAAVETDDVVVTDQFDPILSNISVTLNGVALTQAQYSYNAATGLFQTAAGAITVPAASFVRDATTGQWTITPGTATLVVTGTV